jgi:hypothetical protein
MHNEPAVAPPASPSAGIVPHSVPAVTEAVSRPPAPVWSPGGRQPVRFVLLLRKLMSALRGDKYMVGAYPPDWAASSTRSDQARRSEDGAPPAAAVVSATPSKGR